MEKTLNKEFVEAFIADKYIGARDFVWGDEGKVSFAYDKEADKPQTIDGTILIDAIRERAEECLVLRGRLIEAQRMYSELMDKCFDMDDLEDFDG